MGILYDIKLNYLLFDQIFVAFHSYLANNITMEIFVTICS